jgi:hypothetical protein
VAHRVDLQAVRADALASEVGRGVLTFSEDRRCRLGGKLVPLALLPLATLPIFSRLGGESFAFGRA